MILQRAEVTLQDSDEDYADTLTFKGLALEIWKAARPDWDQFQQNEIRNEVLTYDRELIELYKKRIDARTETIHNRHKISWHLYKRAVATAIHKNDPTILNNISVLSGSFNQPRHTKMPSWDNAKKYKSFLSDTANCPLNVYAGDGQANQSNQNQLDIHYETNLLGLIKTAKPKLPATPMSKQLRKESDYLPQLLNGEAYLDIRDVYAFYDASVKHYERLAITAKENGVDDHLIKYFEGRAAKQTKWYNANWKGRSTNHQN